MAGADAPPHGCYTADEALRLHLEGRWELVAGEIVLLSPVGFRHGDVVAAIAEALRSFVRPRRLGRVLAGDPGFVLGRNPDTVRAPDVAFVRRERLPRPTPEGFFAGPPDLAVEVLSPGDHWPEVERKAIEFLAAGAVAVWAVDPRERTARVYTAGGARVLGEGDRLDAPALLPGFALDLRALLALADDS